MGELSFFYLTCASAQQQQPGQIFCSVLELLIHEGPGPRRYPFVLALGSAEVVACKVATTCQQFV